jgi:hypothetical protein
MIPKSGYRFSEKIMLQQEVGTRASGGGKSPRHRGLALIAWTSGWYSGHRTAVT